MYIMTYKDIVEINHELEEKQLDYRLHLSDTCGRQSVRIEETGEGDKSSQEESAKETIQQFFLGKGSGIKFLSSGIDFVLEDK